MQYTLLQLKQQSKNRQETFDFTKSNMYRAIYVRLCDCTMYNRGIALVTDCEPKIETFRHVELQYGNDYVIHNV